MEGVRVIKSLDNDELIAIDGGSSTTIMTTAAIVISVVTFIVGVIDGIVRPISCDD